MKTCEYPECEREARFFMGWENKNEEKHFGLVCATCDKRLGRINLAKVGMNIEQAILFEHYLKETAELIEYPDFPEWLVAVHNIKFSYKPPQISNLSTETHSTKLLNLPDVIQGTLRRHNITTIEELAGMTAYDLTKIGRLGPGRLHEIQKALEDFKGGQKNIQ